MIYYDKVNKINWGVTELFGGNFGVEKKKSIEIEAMLKEICENKSWELIEVK